jgi:threonine synthase
VTTAADHASLWCVACGAAFPLTRTASECGACGGLLEVRADLRAQGRSGAEWRDLFDRRRAALPSAATPVWQQSGVWRFREHVLSDLPDAAIVSKPEGATRLYPGRALGDALSLSRLFVKHEGENPTLSFKDRGMTAGVSWAKHLGLTDVACASTGDTSAALAAYAAEVPGMRAIVLLPEAKITDEQLSQALHAGATTLGLDTDFDGCMRIVVELTRARPIYLLNSRNPVRIEGQKTIGWEAIQDLGWEVPDWFVLPVGNAGNISAVGKGLREWLELGILPKKPRLAGIQAEAADPFFRSYKTGFREHVTRLAGETAATAIRIGAPVSHVKAAREIRFFDGVVAHVSEEELLDAAALANRHGLAICPNSAVALAGAAKLRRDGVLRRDDLVVVVATAHALKFSGTAAAYHRGGGRLANPPRHLPATLESVLSVLDERVP